ncbi:unnamed protein product [Boreogadus saida]
MELMSHEGATFIPPVTSARSPARRGQAPNGAIRRLCLLANRPLEGTTTSQPQQAPSVGSESPLCAEGTIHPIPIIPSDRLLLMLEPAAIFKREKGFGGPERGSLESGTTESDPVPPPTRSGQIGIAAWARRPGDPWGREEDPCSQ